MNLIILGSLTALCLVLLTIEWLGAPWILQLSFKGDIKRESQFLAQYGQSVATPLAALLVWQFDPAHWKYPIVIIVAVCTASVSCFILKRLLGRVRPNREGAGRFLGPSITHANWRESFPSSHSACAVALSTTLTYFYPQAWFTFLGLAFITALLRWVLDAHFPSDIWGGIALGYASAMLIIRAFGL
jgi:undecaprenyl-diphosphatase